MGDIIFSLLVGSSGNNVSGNKASGNNFCAVFAMIS
ncbi:MAG: hypothetical protein HQ511_05545 [Rhodospirillales bacterium]|nr:hypothetical protein [Rhodospirillales bacterium]